MFGKITKLNTATLFVYTSIFCLVVAFIALIFFGKSVIDIQLHDTMFVVAYFHIAVAIAIFFAIPGSVYYWFPRLFKRYMNETLGKVHFYTTVIGILCIFLPMKYMDNLPRENYSYANFERFNNFNNLAAFLSVVVIIVFLAQILFVVNLFYSLFRDRKITYKN